LARRRKGRSISGILLLDKPLGLSSNAALQRVKRFYNADKAGHTGSLDPLATGMLPICLGEATKFSTFLLDADKSYLATCKLGVITATGDAEGEVVEEQTVEHYTEQHLAQVVAQFTGEIEQIPPMYSALKHNGQPLYKLAREGVEIERKSRQVTIFELEILRYQGDELDIRVHCSKGTYIRTLAEDIGRFLGCGAHITMLRREWVAGYKDYPMVTLELVEQLAEQGSDVLDEKLLPMETALSSCPEVNLTADASFYICRGQQVFVPNGPANGLVKLYSDSNQFLGVGEVQSDGKIAPKRLITTG
jgi:tRNA pseudouridine55 synthase